MWKTDGMNVADEVSSATLNFPSATFVFTLQQQHTKAKLMQLAHPIVSCMQS